MFSEEVTRQLIINEYQNRMSVDELAFKSGYHVNSIDRIIRNWENKRSFRRKSGAGRRPSLTPNDKSEIIMYVNSNPTFSIKQIKGALGLEVCYNTISSYLKEKGYSYRYPEKKPKLTEDNKCERALWAIEHLKDSIENMIFADECSFWLHSTRLKMWRKEGTETAFETEAFPDKSIFGQP